MTYFVRGRLLGALLPGLVLVNIGMAEVGEKTLTPTGQERPLFRPSPFTGEAPAFVAPPAGLTPESLGLNREQTLQLKLLSRAEQHIERFHLPLEVMGFSKKISHDEEFRLYQGRQPKHGGILLNSRFWIDQGFYDSDTYLIYVLFRASADYIYRRHFDAEHCAWLIQAEAEPLSAMGFLKTSIDTSASDWMHPGVKPSDRDEAFRESLDPQGNPVRILQALTRYALQAIEQRAADDWAVAHYHKIFKEPETSLIRSRVDKRERALAWDFSRAVSAMTLPERLAFRRVLRQPFRYVRQPEPSFPRAVLPTTLADGGDAGAPEPLQPTDPATANRQ